MNSNLIAQNPHRVLGVLTNASKKEIASSLSKMKAFLRVGKPLDCDYDLTLIARYPVERSLETLTKAYGDITLPKDKFAAGLLWFMMVTEADRSALEFLKQGKTQQAIAVLKEEQNVSALINQAVICLTTNYKTNALCLYALMFDDGDRRNELITLLTGSLDWAADEDLVHILVDTLLRAFPAPIWFDAIDKIKFLSADEQKALLASQVYHCLVSELIRCSKSALDGAQKAAELVIKSEEWSKLLDVAIPLTQLVSEHLPKLKFLWGETSQEFIYYSDKIANTLLVLGVNIHNHSDSGNAVSEAERLFVRARAIAIGESLRERCQDLCNKIQEISVVQESDNDFKSGCAEVSLKFFVAAAVFMFTIGWKGCSRNQRLRKQYETSHVSIMNEKYSAKEVVYKYGDPDAIRERLKNCKIMRHCEDQPAIGGLQLPAAAHKQTNAPSGRGAVED